MGKCVSTGTKGGLRNEENCPNFRNLLHEKEEMILKLIYLDLGNRHDSHSLTHENFLLFFHKNGYWGDRLFKEFDYDQSNLITQEEFIKGIVKIFKTSEDEKIRLLFKFFSGGNSREKGVRFNEFLTMLYNYPKEEIKNILNDQDFINKEIRANLVAIDNEYEGRRLASVCPGDILNKEISKTQFRLEDNESGVELESKIGRGIIDEFSKNPHEKGSMTLKFKVGNNDVEVKTASIHHIVKKFARNIFKEYNINIITGTLKLPEFTDWMRKHKNLYHDYYNGFHNEIWEVDQATERPLFTLKKPEFGSKAHILSKQSCDLHVELFLLHSILIVFRENDFLNPMSIICLEGLAAVLIFEEEHGYGIELSHREGVYEIKKFFFKDEELQKNWMEYLKFYKGSSITQLFEMGEKIGVGKFSVVYRCVEKSTGDEFAIKVIQSFKLTDEEKIILAHESSIMSILSHPLLVFFKECVQSKTHIYIITELVKGKDLYELIRECSFLGEKESAYIIRQVIIGVRYLHSLGIMHRDLKPENIMVEYNEEKKELGRIKIIDFGFAIYLSTLHEYCQSADFNVKQALLAGTPNYIAPQLLRAIHAENEKISEKIDNFSIGSILYVMLCGKFAFNGTSTEEILRKTLDGGYSINDKKWKGVSKNAKDLVARLLENDPEDRISLDDALKHPWLRELEEGEGGAPFTSYNMVSAKKQSQ